MEIARETEASPTLFSADGGQTFEYRARVEADPEDYALTFTVRESGEGKAKSCSLSGGFFSETVDSDEVDGLPDSYREEIDAEFPGSTSEDGSLGSRLVDAAEALITHAREDAECPLT